MNYTVRKATENDRASVATAISLSFQKIFAVFTKDMTRMAKVFESGIEIDRFFVAEENSEIIGIAAFGDCVKRVLSATKTDCTSSLGTIRGTLAHRVIRSELMRPHSYPPTTAYIDILGVLPQARGKGVAKALLRELTISCPQYTDFVLDVDSINEPAIKSYTDFGFVEYERVRVIKFLKRAKIYMKYTPKESTN